MKAIKDLIESIKCRKVRGNWSFYQFHVWRLYRKYVKPWLDEKPKTIILEYAQFISRREFIDAQAIDVRKHYERKMINRIIDKAYEDGLIVITEHEAFDKDGIALTARLEIVVK